MTSILSFPFLANTGFSSFKQPIANPPPPSLDSLNCSKIKKFSNLNFPSSLNLVSSMKNMDGCKLLIIFLKVGNLGFKPAALTPIILNVLENVFALHLFPRLFLK